MKKRLKKWEELKINEEEHFKASSAIFQDVITGKLDDQLREELKHLLGLRHRGIGVIMPDTLLLQLQYGAYEGEKLVDAIMQFEDTAISKALGILTERGLR